MRRGGDEVTRSKLLFGILSASAISAFAACAENDPVTTPPEQVPPMTIPGPDAAAPPVVTDAADAGVSLDCSLYDFCSVDFPVTRETSLNAVWGSGPDDVWAVGDRGTILHNDGTKFTSVTAGGTDVYFAVWGSAKNDVWLVNATAPFHSTGYSGAATTFTAVTGSTWVASGATSGRMWTGISHSTSAIWMAGDSTSRFGGSGSFWELGDGGGDAGVAWKVATSCPTSQYYCVAPQVRGLWGSDHEHTYAVGPHGGAYLTSTPSATSGRWTQLDTRSSVDLYGVWGSTDSDVWAVGLGGSILHLTTPNGPWTTVASPTTNTLYGIWGAAADDIYAVGDSGTVLHYDGKQWLLASVGRQEDEPATNLTAVWGSGTDDVTIVGAGAILHRSATSQRHP